MHSNQTKSCCSVLSVKVIGYLGKCFWYCVAQNKGNTTSLQANIRNIVPHAFGKYENCNESWCQYKKDPVNYKHNELPFGKDLHGDALEKVLNENFFMITQLILLSRNLHLEAIHNGMKL